MELSIILVSYNTKDLLRQCLSSIYDQTRGIDFEVFVVDNASKDGTREMLDAEFSKLHVIKNDENLVFAAANNQAMRLASGEFVLLLNSDTVIIDGAIQRTVGEMKNHSKAGILGCRLVNPDGSPQLYSSRFPTIAQTFSEAFFLYRIVLFDSPGKEDSRGNEDLGLREVDFVCGAFMMIRRAVLELVGLLDERYFMYSEDTDFCFRVKKAGYEVLFLSQVAVIHYGGVTLRSLESLLLNLHRNHFYFVKKNYPPWEYFFIAVLKYVGMILRIFVYAVYGFLAGDQSYLKKSAEYAKITASLLKGGTASVDQKRP
jgi:GT2 family glycosyltransferase